MSDLRIKEVEYRDFSHLFHQKTGKPVVGQMELTFRCGLNCVHCYSACYNNDELTGEELTFSGITAILDQLSQEGCLWLSFTGGDPLMRDDFPDIYHYAKEKGFIITILTNGTSITPELADYLMEKPPLSIDITLNAVTPETYERISRIPGSFERCMEGIRLILDRNLPLKLKTKAITLNYHELNKIKEYVEGLGMEFRLTYTVNTQLNGSTKPCSFRLSPEQVADIDRFYQDGQDCQEGITPPNPLLIKGGEERLPDKLFRCAAGISSFHISPYGELLFCTYLRSPNFDLKKGSFREGFYTLMPGIRSAEYQTGSKCRNCEIFQFCHQCPAAAKLENGDPEKPIKYFCELAHRYTGQAK